MKKHSLEIQLEDLTVIEEFLERVKRGKRMQVTSTARLQRALERATTLMQGRLLSGYKLAAANTGRRIKGKVLIESEMMREYREQRNKQVYSLIEEYVKGKEHNGK